jgi:hypothetical protein
MKTFCIFAMLCCTIPAFALSGGMEKAIVYSMHKVPCPDSPGAPRAGTLPPGYSEVPDAGGQCVEYELRTEKVSYIIRPRHVVLLLLGGSVAIKFAGSELLVHTGDYVKDIHCAVLAMTLRTEAEQRERAAPSPVRCYVGDREVACPEP